MSTFRSSAARARRSGSDGEPFRVSIGRVLLLRAGGVPALLRDTGEPTLTRRAVGKGQVYYLGACFSEEMVRRLLTDPSL